MVGTITVGGAPGPALTLTIENVSGAVGALASVDVVLQNATSGVSGFDIEIEVTKSSVAEIDSVSLPAYGFVTQVTGIPGPSVKVSAIDFNHLLEPRRVSALPSSDVLATLMVKLLSPGTTDLNFTLIRIDDESGDVSLNPSVNSGKVTVQ